MGTVSVEADNASGRLEQIGSDNIFELTVTGDGSNVTYQLVGCGVNGTQANGGPAVFSNAGAISIRQTVLGQN
ncbi:hypothetical protein [Jannaschia seohaensis]|uniref:Uncharacterized protein n=1 Tax=Jannaschia seohaensis TaxID=475081 RepID=A0A2Y9B1C0_9RHOB|nr:hypothetical protein [Jannaschia seohaensis]PWJ14467.1 hypothetical protein BCF38_11290 [Jannaschia seohaensis]SSA50216.1 hypothetical protein SAMN05421539_11290 [Jannaschia seohaensis]